MNLHQILPLINVKITQYLKLFNESKRRITAGEGQLAILKIRQEQKRRAGAFVGSRDDKPHIKEQPHGPNCSISMPKPPSISPTKTTTAASPNRNSSTCSEN